MTENHLFLLHQFEFAFPGNLKDVADHVSSEHDINGRWSICYQDFDNSICCYHWAQDTSFRVVEPDCDSVN